MKIKAKDLETLATIETTCNELFDLIHAKAKDINYKLTVLVVPDAKGMGVVAINMDGVVDGEEKSYHFDIPFDQLQGCEDGLAATLLVLVGRLTAQLRKAFNLPC